MSILIVLVCLYDLMFVFQLSAEAEKVDQSIEQLREAGNALYKILSFFNQKVQFTVMYI